jgi:hypothetical protein
MMRFVRRLAVAGVLSVAATTVVGVTAAAAQTPSATCARETLETVTKVAPILSPVVLGLVVRNCNPEGGASLTVSYTTVLVPPLGSPCKREHDVFDGGPYTIRPGRKLATFGVVLAPLCIGRWTVLTRVYQSGSDAPLLKRRAWFIVTV